MADDRQQGAGTDGSGGASRLSRPVVYALLASGLISFAMGQTILFAVLGPLARRLGLTELHVGVLVSATALVIAFASPWWGRRSDEWGRRFVIVFGLATFGLTMVAFSGVILLGLAGVISGTVAFAGMLSARLLYALLSAGIQPTAAAFVADTTTGRERTAGLALVSGAYGVGMVAGPIFGAAFSFVGLVTPLWAVTILAFASALAIFLFLPGKAGPRSSAGAEPVRLRNPRTAPLLFLMFGVLAVGSATQQTAAFYLQDRFGYDDETTVQAVGLIMALSALSMILTQGVIVQIFKPRPALLVRVGFGVAIATFVILYRSTEFLWIAAGYSGMGLAMGLLYPGLMAAASLSVHQREQGSVAGLMGSATSSGVVVGPLLGTSLYGIDPAMPFLVSIVIVTGLFAMSWRIRFYRPGLGPRRSFSSIDQESP